MKVLYVLVSSNNDIFLEQTILSIYSLKLHSPQIKVAILMDDFTASSLINQRSVVLNMIDEKIVVELDKTYSNKFKSRFLKTSMRNYVNGDFLYIDSDTIILEDIVDIKDVTSNLAAVYEFNMPYSFLYKHSFLNENVARFGYPTTEYDEYFNSGVMWVRDTKVNRDFFSKWHNNWIKSTKLGIYFDQPSLFITNKEENNYLERLSDIWNCQGIHCFNYIRKAKVFHYLYDESFDFPLMKKESFNSIKRNGEIDDYLKSIVANPFEYISQKNLLVMNDTFDLLKTRQYRFLKIYYMKCRKVYSFFDRIIDGVYKCYLKLKKRDLAPPR